MLKPTPRITGLHHKGCGGILEETWSYWEMTNTEYPSGLYPTLTCLKCQQDIPGDASIQEDSDDFYK